MVAVTVNYLVSISFVPAALSLYAEVGGCSYLYRCQDAGITFTISLEQCLTKLTFKFSLFFSFTVVESC